MFSHTSAVASVTVIDVADIVTAALSSVARKSSRSNTVVVCAREGMLEWRWLSDSPEVGACIQRTRVSKSGGAATSPMNQTETSQSKRALGVVRTHVGEVLVRKGCSAREILVAAALADPARHRHYLVSAAPGLAVVGTRAAMRREAWSASVDSRLSLVLQQQQHRVSALQPSIRTTVALGAAPHSARDLAYLVEVLGNRSGAVVVASVASVVEHAVPAVLRVDGAHAVCRGLVRVQQR
eukprot:1067553-Rhodomonas_salina.1